MSRYRYIMPLLCAVALVLTGCGGGDSGVDQSTHDMLQTELDAALAQLMEEEEAHETSQAEVARLQSDLATTRLRVAALETQIGAATDAADASATASLHAQLNAAKASVATLTAEIGTAGDSQSLTGMLEAEKVKVTRLTAELSAANTSLTTLRGQLTTAQQAAATAQQQATAAQQQAATAVARASEVEGSREASQRAQYLQAAFPVLDTGQPTLSSLVEITVPSRGRLAIKHGGFRDATLGGSGLRSVTMPLASTVNTGKTVVYTDRELSRPLLDHYDSLRDSGDMTRFGLTGDLAIAGGTIPHVATPQVSTMWRIAHGVPTSVAAQDNSADPPVANVLPDTAEAARPARASYTGHLHGLSGSFVCGGVSGCLVQVTPDYGDSGDPDDITNGRFTLQSVAIAAVAPPGVTTTGSTLYFRPSAGATLQLYEGGPDGADLEYMVFGYWREDPLSPASPYDNDAIGVFAEVFSGTGSQDVPAVADITATYRGTAVGLYVEQEQSDPIDTHRQGEFVANAILTVDGTTNPLSGTIRDFRTTPTAGSASPESSERWVVQLVSGGAVVLNNQSGTSVGGWNHAYVQAHQHASDATPLGITGVFNAHLGDIARDPALVNRVAGDSLHIIGAFGAHRR